MWCLFPWDIRAQNSCSIHLSVLSAPRQEFTFPWKGLAGESERPGSSSGQNGFTIFLELLFNLSADWLGADGNVTVHLGTQWVFNGLLHRQSPKTAGKPSCGQKPLQRIFTRAAAGCKSIWVKFLCLPCSNREVRVMSVEKSRERWCCQDLRAEHLTPLLSL